MPIAQAPLSRKWETSERSEHFAVVLPHGPDLRMKRNIRPCNVRGAAMLKLTSGSTGFPKRF